MAQYTEDQVQALLEKQKAQVDKYNKDYYKPDLTPLQAIGNTVVQSRLLGNEYQSTAAPVYVHKPIAQTIGLMEDVEKRYIKNKEDVNVLNNTINRLEASATTDKDKEIASNLRASYNNFNSQFKDGNVHLGDATVDIGDFTNDFQNKLGAGALKAKSDADMLARQILREKLDKKTLDEEDYQRQIRNLNEINPYKTTEDGSIVYNNKPHEDLLLNTVNYYDVDKTLTPFFKDFKATWYVDNLDGTFTITKEGSGLTGYEIGKIVTKEELDEAGTKLLENDSNYTTFRDDKITGRISSIYNVTSKNPDGSITSEGAEYLLGELKGMVSEEDYKQLQSLSPKDLQNQIETGNVLNSVKNKYTKDQIEPYSSAFSYKDREIKVMNDPKQQQIWVTEATEQAARIANEKLISSGNLNKNTDIQNFSYNTDPYNTSTTIRDVETTIQLNVADIGNLDKEKNKHEVSFNSISKTYNIKRRELEQMKTKLGDNYSKDKTYQNLASSLEKDEIALSLTEAKYRAVKKQAEDIRENVVEAARQSPKYSETYNKIMDKLKANNIEEGIIKRLAGSIMAAKVETDIYSYKNPNFINNSKEKNQQAINKIGKDLNINLTEEVDRGRLGKSTIPSALANTIHNVLIDDSILTDDILSKAKYRELTTRTLSVSKPDAKDLASKEYINFMNTLLPTASGMSSMDIRTGKVINSVELVKLKAKELGYEPKEINATPIKIETVTDPNNIFYTSDKKGFVQYRVTYQVEDTNTKKKENITVISTNASSNNAESDSYELKKHIKGIFKSRPKSIMENPVQRAYFGEFYANYNSELLKQFSDANYVATNFKTIGKNAMPTFISIPNTNIEYAFPLEYTGGGDLNDSDKVNPLKYDVQLIQKDGNSYKIMVSDNGVERLEDKSVYDANIGKKDKYFAVTKASLEDWKSEIGINALINEIAQEGK